MLMALPISKYNFINEYSIAYFSRTLLMLGVYKKVEISNIFIYRMF